MVAADRTFVKILAATKFRYMSANVFIHIKSMRKFRLLILAIARKSFQILAFDYIIWYNKKAKKTIKFQEV